MSADRKPGASPRLVPVALAAMVLAAGAAAGEARAVEPRRPPNVLFVVIDDLNDWVGYLDGHPAASTPNLDRLARRGVRFTRAYTPAPLCNPARTAILSGLRPSSTGVYDNSIDPRPVIDPALMLQARFREAGYFVAGAGKISHRERTSDWDEYHRHRGPERDADGERVADGERDADDDRLIAPRPTDLPETELPDHRNVSWIIERLEQPPEQPFFLAIGLHKPHLAWDVPRRYYEQFPLDSIELPPFREDDLDDLPEAGVRMARALKQADQVRAEAAAPGKPVQSDYEAVVAAGASKRAIQGYLAAIAFMDWNLGRLIDALDRSPSRDDTIVVVWSDNGWHSGEKHHWRKSTLWEEATHVPLIWIAPGVTRPEAVSDRTVDLMSIYPTLLDLAGIPIPPHVEGTSIRPLLEDPAAAWDRPAVTTHLLANHAVRTERWRYIRYADGGEELYDEANDPFEWTNLASKPDSAPIKQELSRHFPSRNEQPVASDPSILRGRSSRKKS